jgi:D-alanyl-D-alanine carboxypeptidase/D-alanyl-D-alanine-endopeptidase (penicillin-binding protein 4)
MQFSFTQHPLFKTITKHLLWVIASTIVLASCAPAQKLRYGKNGHEYFNHKLFENQFTGVLVIDAQTKDTLVYHNAHKYFTPASNTKIATLATAISVLGKQTPALTYTVQNDTVYFKGTGDPSQLHPYYIDSTVTQLLSKQKNLVYCPENFRDNAYGPGWAWEDYDTYYSPERSALPLFGNVVTIFQEDSLQIVPEIFKDSVYSGGTRNRKPFQNRFNSHLKPGDSLEIPYITSTKNTQNLLTSLLDKNIEIGTFPKGDSQSLYSVPTDSLLKRLMHQSDNFIAEQLMLLSAGTLTDTLNFNIARKYALEVLFPEMPQEPRWVDGSGLSRYNLFTPASLVYLLDRLYAEIPQERLFHLFPTGGKEGTLKHYYAGNPRPYLHAKSGSLGNNYNLSGYLVTDSGRVLIFSFMNNHYRQPTQNLKTRMTIFFEAIRDNL